MTPQTDSYWLVYDKRGKPTIVCFDGSAFNFLGTDEISNPKRFVEEGYVLVAEISMEKLLVDAITEKSSHIEWLETYGNKSRSESFNLKIDLKKKREKQ